MGTKLIRALEFSGSGELYAYESPLWGPGQLYLVDPATASLQPIGPSTNVEVHGMAYNPVDGKMYGVNAPASVLVSIDLISGYVTYEGTIQDSGPLGWNWMAGIAVDELGYFYLYNNADDTVYSGLSEQGIFRSQVPGGLQFDMIRDLRAEFGISGGIGLQTPAPFFIDWSSPGQRGYGWGRQWTGAATTGWYGYDWDAQGVNWTLYSMYPLANSRFYAWTASPHETGVPYCFGDPADGTPCPCGNDNDGSVPGSGCANGAFASGAQLAGSGTASLAADTLELATTGLEPSQAGLYFQADSDLSPGTVWGDGLRCTGGQLKRLGVVFSDATGYSDTSGYALPISVKAGNVTAGDTKYYQCWYRNPSGSPCGNDFNASNGYAVSWTL